MLIDIFVFVLCPLNTLFSTWYVVYSLLHVIFLRGCLGMSILRPILRFQAGWIFRSSDRITISFSLICSWSFKSSTVDNSVAIYAGCLQHWGKCNHGAVMCLHHGNPARFHWFTSILGMSGKSMWLSGFGINGCLFSLFGLESYRGGRHHKPALIYSLSHEVQQHHYSAGISCGQLLDHALANFLGLSIAMEIQTDHFPHIDPLRT